MRKTTIDMKKDLGLNYTALDILYLEELPLIINALKAVLIAATNKGYTGVTLESDYDAWFFMRDMLAQEAEEYDRKTVLPKFKNAVNEARKAGNIRDNKVKMTVTSDGFISIGDMIFLEREIEYLRSINKIGEYSNLRNTPEQWVEFYV